MRRSRRTALIATIATFVVAAALTTTGADAATRSAVNPNGVLKYARDLPNAFGDNFDPATEVNDCSYGVTNLIFESLTRDGSNTKVSGGVAESWEVDASHTTVTMHLRQGNVFSDGTPVDANAVKASILNIKKSPLRTSLAIITTIDTPDPNTVVFHLSKPVAGDFLWALTYIDGQIVAPSALTTADSKPVGSGPFMLSTYRPDQLISLKKNPKSRLASQYKLAGVDFVQVGSGPQAVTALKSDQVDMIDLRPEDYPTVKADPKLAISTTPSLDYTMIQLRQDRAPFDNDKVRAALEFAVDRQEIDRVVYNGRNEVADQPFPKGTAGHDPALSGKYSYQPKKAKKMLAAAGFAKGVSFDMVIPAGAPTFERMAPLLKNEMARAGFTVNIKRVPGGQILDTVYLHKESNAFLSVALTNGPALWNNFQSNYSQGGFVAATMGSRRPEIEALVSEARVSLDPKVFGPPMLKAGRLIMQEGLEVPLVFEQGMVAYNKARVGGPPKAPIGSCRSNLEGVFIKK